MPLTSIRSISNSVYIKLGCCSAIFTIGVVWILNSDRLDYQAAVEFNNNALSTTAIVTNTTSIPRECHIVGGGWMASSCTYSRTVSTIQFETQQREVVEVTDVEVTDDNLELLATKKEVRVQIFYAPNHPKLIRIKGDIRDNPLAIVRYNTIFKTLFLLIIIIGIGTATGYIEKPAR
jgi:hypothetical protein